MTPKHIAIIMDGNRRWAKQKGLPAIAGHQYVANQLLEKLIDHAAEKKIAYITFWAWSTENWQRDKQEVSGIMILFKKLLSRYINRLHEKNIRFKTIGDISKFPKDIYEGICNGEEKTKNNTKITAILALNYGGRDEILRAINKLLSHPDGPRALKDLAKCRDGLSGLDVSPAVQHDNSVTSEILSSVLDTSGIPDPDLIIRPGGEKRLSGFLPWQSEYAELYFTDVLMPDFSIHELDKALEDFDQRQRRFGK